MSSASRTASILVGAIGGLVFFGGWMLGIALLKSAGGGITMKANGALGLLLGAVSLWFIGSESRHGRRVGIACAALMGLLGAATLSQHLMGWDLGIDQLLFVESAGAAATASPNRIGPNASLSFFLQSVALILLHRSGSRGIARAQVISAGATILAIIPLVGYAYGAEELYRLARISSIAMHTAAALLILGIGIVTARLDVGPVGALTSEGAGGVLTRRMIVPSLVLPFLLGYLWLIGERAGYYDAGLKSALSRSAGRIAHLVRASDADHRTGGHRRSDRQRGRGADAGRRPPAGSRRMPAAEDAYGVAGDSRRLEQIVRNLLSNTIKFTGAGGSVTISTRRVSDAIVLDVCDTGCGIEAGFLPHVFDRFRQGDSSLTREHGGLGLGLAIVRDLTALHQGGVEITSPGAGLGTTVTVKLPLVASVKGDLSRRAT
jgi:Histidine kinase-, DNA gyrase B-, and HSP90-like ATPase